MNEVAKESFVRISFLMNKIVTRGLAIFVLVFFLASAFIFYQYSQVGQSEEFVLPDNVANTAYGFVEGVLKARIGDFDGEMTVDEYLVSTMTSRQKEQLIGDEAKHSAELEMLLEKNKKPDGTMDAEKFLASLPVDTRMEFEKSKEGLYEGLGVEVENNSEMTIKELIINVMNQMANNFFSGNKKLIPIAFTVVFFVALEIFYPLFYLITLLFAMIIYGILRSSRFITMTTERKDVDRIEI